MNKTVKSQFLNEKQVSEMTSIPLQTLRNNRFQRKGINYVKIGRSVRYELSDVVGFMQSHKIQTEDAAGERK